MRHQQTLYLDDEIMERIRGRAVKSLRSLSREMQFLILKGLESENKSTE